MLIIIVYPDIVAYKFFSCYVCYNLLSPKITHSFRVPKIK